MHPPETRLAGDWIGQAFSEPGTVLLESGFADQSQAKPLLFRAPTAYITASQPQDVAAAFAELQAALASGHHVAGYASYEAGLALHGIPAHPLPSGEPLLCFGVYAAPESLSTHQPIGTAATPFQPLAFAPMPAISREKYSRRIDAIQAWIAAGDIYQANFTIPLQSLSKENPEDVFRALVQQQPAPYAAILRLQPPGIVAPTILSFSPELFFCTGSDGSIRTQPMKGTSPRAEDAGTDLQRAAALAADPKNRAEHIMIVDLLRNDLGRICEIGSVQTDNLFTVKTLPTVHQMISDIHGRLRPHTSWSDVFRALFPSGSITGAPKLRAMQCLHGVENAPRGVYTGAIGYIAPSGASCFSVAIRTLILRPRQEDWEITGGVGGGIVADSTADAEYAEALLKGEFLRRAAQPVEIIETVRAEAGHVRWIEQHLDRIGRTAADLELPIDRPSLRQQLELHARSQSTRAAQRVRIRLGQRHRAEIHSQPLDPWPASLRVRLATRRTHLGDPALAHKTNFREHYDQEQPSAREAGFDEALFANDAGLVTEGAVTSMFFVRDGQILTPYIACGALPGILRGQLLQRELVTESLLPVQQLENCQALFLGNSLRGIFPVRSLQLNDGREIAWLPEAVQPHLEHLRTVFQSQQV